MSVPWPYRATAAPSESYTAQLHAIQVLAALLRAAAQRSQVIVSTQSVTLVNQFEPKDVVIVERHERASVFRRADEQGVSEWVDDYGLGAPRFLRRK